MKVRSFFEHNLFFINNIIKGICVRGVLRRHVSSFTRLIPKIFQQFWLFFVILGQFFFTLIDKSYEGSFYFLTVNYYPVYKPTVFLILF